VDHGSTPYSVDLKKSSLTLPIVGDLSVAKNAGDTSQVPWLGQLSTLTTHVRGFQLPS